MPKTGLKKAVCYIIVSICILLSYNSQGQEHRVNNTTQLWTEVDMLGRINKKWKWQCDFQYSRQSPYENISFTKYGEQLTVRPWVHFYPVPWLKLSAFVGLWYNYPITDVGARRYAEYRTAVQGQYYKTWGKNLFSNRLRPELRYIQDRQGAFELAFRGRYMLKYQHLLTHKTYDGNSWYSILSDEIFLNGGSEVTGYKTFDQNRIFLGLGYNITSDIAAEAGYYNQYAHHSHDIDFDSNHVLQVSLIFDNLTKLNHG